RPALSDARFGPGHHRADRLLQIASQEVSMAVKRAKTSRQSGTGKSPAKQASKAKVTKLSTARKKLASKGPAPAAKKKAAKSAAKAVPAKQPVVNVVENALDEMKAVNVKVLAVNKLTDITDTMIIA